MEQFWTSFNIVIPLVIMMATGFLIRRVGLVSEDAFRIINRIVFYVGIPTLVFHGVVTDRTPARWQFALWVAGSVLVAFALSMLLARVLTKDPSKRGTLAQAAYRSNDGIFGLAVATALMGEGKTGTMAFTLVISASLFGLTGVLCYELNRGGNVKPAKVLLNLLKNPILWAAALAFLVRFTGIELPYAVLKPIEYFKNMCTPLGFLVLGGVLSFKSLKEDWKLVTIISAVKLIAFPVAVCSLAYFAGGLRGPELASIFIVFSAPTAMSCLPMASELGGDVKLSGELIAVTTVLSLLTVFLYLTFFGGILA
ncbi:MAG: AEC family transporter [Clostridia bacterium]|nr:AEC family transporter [Clostridia bacterium]